MHGKPGIPPQAGDTQSFNIANTHYMNCVLLFSRTSYLYLSCWSRLGPVLYGLIAALGLSSATALAASPKEPARLPQCSWDEPGHNPFMGDVVAAVDRYTDIPVAVRNRLKQRMAKREYDDIASIRRDSIEGRARYDTKIRDMHFGVGRVCSTVSRQAWLPSHQERGLVYCEGSECIIVPTVCRNVSRVKRDPSGVLASRDLLAPEVAPFADALLFDAPAAGPLQFANAGPQDGYSGSGPFQGDPGVSGFPGGPDVNMPAGDPGALPGILAGDPRAGPTGGGRMPDSGPLPGKPGLQYAEISGVVPEPQTWLLVLLGVAACGAVKCRRSRATALSRASKPSPSAPMFARRGRRTFRA